MRDRDDIDMSTWVRRACADEPAAGSMGDTIGDDLTRGRARLARHRRWTAGASGVAVAAVAFAIAMVPSMMPGSDDGLDPAGTSQGVPDGKADPPGQRRTAPPKGDGYPYYEQRRLLYDVAEEHLDPQDKHLSMTPGIQFMLGTSVGTKLNWKIAGEPGLGVVRVGIASPGLSDRDLRIDAGCDGHYTCEPRELPDGSTAWVGQRDGTLGAAYRQPDGEAVWVVADPLFGNNSTVPVSGIDVSVQQLLSFVTDDRLEFLGGPACLEGQPRCSSFQDRFDARP